MQSFKDMDLVPALREALEIMKYETPTPVQAAAIPIVLEGSDLMACAQTGTGKTAAFALPLLMHMSDKNRNKGNSKPVLILAPTRELVEQIAEVISQLTVKARHCKIAVIIGGVGYNHQIRDLRSNPSFIIATPGRLIDHLDSGRVQLGNFGVLVLDEADRMLDMGFAPQLEEIVSRMPADRQTLLFSATLDGDVGRIARKYLRDPKSVSVAASHTPIEKITQNVVRTLQKEKPQTLLKEIDKITGSIIIFARTKARTEQVAKNLDNAGHEVEMIHGDRSQSQRKRSLDNFRKGKARILVATDVAARGLDIPHIEHVFNYDLPMQPEDYIHRIGRTARAGREGDAWSFVTPDDEGQWNRIYKLMYGKFPEGAKRTGGGGGSRPWDKNRGGSQRPQRSAGGSSRPATRPSSRSERPEVTGFGDRPRTSRPSAPGVRSERPVREERAERPQRAFTPPTDGRTYANRAERDASRAKRFQESGRAEKTARATENAPVATAATAVAAKPVRTGRPVADRASRGMAPIRAERTSERPSKSIPAVLGGERRPKRSEDRRDRDQQFDSKPNSEKVRSTSTKPRTKLAFKSPVPTEGKSSERSQRRGMDDRPQARETRAGAKPVRKGMAPPWARSQRTERKREEKPVAKPRHKSLV